MLKLDCKIALKLKLNKAGALALSAIALTTPTVAIAAAGRSTPPTTTGEACQSSIGGGGALEARFWSGGTTVEVPYERSAVIAGRVTTADGAPLSDATLEVEESLIGAGAAAGERVAVPRVGFARTTLDGSYAYRMPAGPNREAVVTYRDGESEAACALRYFAAARPTLTVSPRRTTNRGRPIGFWGRLPGPRAAGHVLVLQVRRGTGWITFRRATTDRSGRFQAFYRFQMTFQPALFTFRALVPRQAAYPWLQGTSRLVSVTVYPG
jgi:rare lipoprotein A